MYTFYHPIATHVLPFIYLNIFRISHGKIIKKILEGKTKYNFHKRTPNKPSQEPLYVLTSAELVSF
jgi:hypothetical protein